MTTPHKDDIEKRTIDEATRKEIYRFRKTRREEKNNPLIEELYKKIFIDYLMRITSTHYSVWREYTEKAADSTRFAMDELTRFKIHCEDVHGNGNSCSDMDCLEDITIDDAKDYTNTIFKHIKEFYRLKE